MKKRFLSTITNQRGFILPVVLFTISIFFILITATITSYQNEIHMSEAHLERVKMHTLLQMSFQLVMEEYDDLSALPHTLHYSFLQGEVNITTTSITDDTWETLAKVTTNNHSEHTFKHTINIRHFYPTD
ncbi:hypothetical protein QNH47_06510 [Virgibacillus halodenitrificans]|uniref:hypothetical protein n=1 Tax=Virgibacillus halodenitrificans TaxID=1482 RepID=UPI0024BF77F3|nr:hypothetical protein [Virgibacillus halodenitrificans]WHX27503.1 hypothetical protein QNH47_06510 [Virgibacillus halodenitrificans]